MRLASPGLQPIARRVVQGISGNRIGISHLLRLQGDDALQARITEIACDNCEGLSFRLIAGGRTGGAFAQVQLDNILVEAIPEPSIGLLALAGVRALSTRRRRQSA